MHNAYQIGQWQSLYTTLGGSAAALAGLLFIAVSIQIGRIAKSPIFRTRAWGNTFIIVSLVVNAGFVLTPQSLTALGIELSTRHRLHYLHDPDDDSGSEGGFAVAVARFSFHHFESGGCGVGRQSDYPSRRRHVPGDVGIPRGNRLGDVRALGIAAGHWRRGAESGDDQFMNRLDVAR